MEKKGSRRIKYWAVLLNPVFLALYIAGCRYLYQLCQWGGVRRRLPVIAVCGLLGVTWIIIWTVIYLKNKKKGNEKAPGRAVLFSVIFCVELLVVLGTTAIYGTKIIHSARNYNGQLSWKLEEWRNKKEIPLKHGNIYTDGIEGIFSDLEEKLDLPRQLYLNNRFEVQFEESGIITGIEGFFYGKDDNGDSETFLIDYPSGNSDKMTVWVDGHGETEFKDSMKMDPMFELMEQADVEETVREWAAVCGASLFEIQYDGYNLTLSSPEQTGPSPVVYKNPEADREADEQKEFTEELTRETGRCITDASDGSLYYFINENKGWRLVVTDAAAGSRYYELDATSDGGNTWERINKDPFGGEIGVASEISFSDDGTGCLVMGSASGERTERYLTTDEGKTFVKE